MAKREELQSQYLGMGKCPMIKVKIQVRKSILVDWWERFDSVSYTPKVKWRDQEKKAKKKKPCSAADGGGTG